MPEDPADIAAFKRAARSDPTHIDLPRLEEEVYGTNDRACAVLLGSMTETCLTIFLRSKLRPSINSDDRRSVFDFSGPCGTFSAKTLMAFAFNFIGPDMRSDLNVIRMIRNEFAHSRKPLDFNFPEIKPVCDRLKLPGLNDSFIPYGYSNSTSIPIEIAGDKSHPKTRYVTACHTISERLLDHSNVVGARRLRDLP